MSKFDEQLQALVDDGKLDAAEAAALRDASPLKAERDAAKAAEEAATTRARALEAKVAADVFAELKIPGSPDAYSLPADLDVTDKAAVTTWAQTKGLVAPGGPSAEEEAAHQRMERVTTGGQPVVPAGPGDRMAELHKIARTAGVTSPAFADARARAADVFAEAGLVIGDVPHGELERIPEWGSTK